MTVFGDSMKEYRKQLAEGVIQIAYRGLMEYLMSLKTDLKKRHPDFHVSSSIYSGYMDMSYFSFTPKTIKDRKLKIAVVFNQENFKFEIWLLGVNKTIQAAYCKMFEENGWSKYQNAPSAKSVDAIVEITLVDEPNFSNLAQLSTRIEKQSMKIIDDIEQFLSEL